MATSDSTLVIDAETAKAVRELVKFAQAQEKIDDTSKKVKRGLGEVAKQSDVMNESVTSATRSIKNMVTGFASLATAQQIIASLNAELKQTVDLSDKAAQGTAAFAAQISRVPGAEKLLKDTRVRGAGFGLTPEETGAIANRIMGAGGNLTTDFDTAAKLKQLGVGPEDAAGIVQMGVVRGIGSERAASMAAQAGLVLSPSDLATMARVAPKTRGFQSAEAGLAAAATLSTAGITNEQLPAAVEAAGRALNKEESALTKKFGLQGMSEAQRLAVLSKAADASGDRAAFIRQLPEKYKLGEEEGRALQAILGSGNKYFESEAALRATGAGDFDAWHQKTRQIDPMFANYWDAQAAAQQSQMRDVYGPAAPFAQDRRTMALGHGARLQTEHPYLSKVPGMVDETTGEPGMLGKGFYNQFESLGRTLVDALKDNTQATRENSGSATPARNANI